MSEQAMTARPMLLDEFLEWDSGDGRLWQLIDGIPTAMAPTRPRHGAILGEMGAILRNHFRETNSPCRCVIAPGVVTPVAADRNMRIPDLAVTCVTPENDMVVAFPDPVLIVEVLSPGNHQETWINVWTYTLIQTVREIVILYSDTIRADILLRRPDGSWPPGPRPVTKGDLVLESIGLSTSLQGIYRDTALGQ